jgi:hypothetical protein
VLLAGPRDEADRTVSDGSLSGVVTLGGADAGAEADQDDDEINDATRTLDSAAAGHTLDSAAARRAGAAVVGDVSEADWEADRAAVAARELTMTELLERRGLRLRDDLLLPWARWITPEFEPKRFDTWFFVALLPEGQTARDVSGESEVATWASPEAAEELPMLPPTRSTVDSLRPYVRIEEVIAASSRRDAATPTMPRVQMQPDGSAVLLVARPPGQST